MKTNSNNNQSSEQPALSSGIIGETEWAPLDWKERITLAATMRCSSPGPSSPFKKTPIASSSFSVHQRSYGQDYPCLLDSVVTDDRDEQHSCPASPRSTSSATATIRSTSATKSEDDSLGEFDRIYTLGELKQRHPVLFRWAWRDGNPHSCLLRLLEFEENDEFEKQVMTTSTTI